MKTNVGFVLLHGAGLGSYIWSDLIPLVDYPILAINFPNRIIGFQLHSSFTLDDYTDSIINVIEKWDIKSIIIVAHSIAGCAGLKIAQHFKKRCIGFVAISAAIPSKGSSYLSCFPFPKKVIMFLLLNIIGTRPPDTLIKRQLCHDLTEEQTKTLLKDFIPESKKLYLDKCLANIPDINTLYIICSKDKAFPLSLQLKMAENLNAGKVISLESGHLPMLSVPKQVAAILKEFIWNCGIYR